MLPPSQARIWLAVVPLLLPVGCAGPHAVSDAAPPISDKPLIAGDKVTHVNGEPVNDYTDLGTKIATTNGTWC